jgi:ubiquinone/menaquinone biosynthesis C-methylase UbiE
VSFDRVASIYDATRGLPDGIVERVVDRMIAATHADEHTRFLEAGIGTGRMALPLINRGFSFTGVDISTKMMDRLREKAGDARNLTLLEADITELPFPDASFDVVLCFHVLHLVPEWRKALREMLRVLSPAGYFVTGGDYGLPGNPHTDMRNQWRVFRDEIGEPARPRYGTWDNVQAEVTELGGRTAMYIPAQWEVELRPIDLLEAQRSKTFSESWSVSDVAMEAIYERMVRWATERYGDLTKPLKSREEQSLVVSRFIDEAIEEKPEETSE